MKAAELKCYLTAQDGANRLTLQPGAGWSAAPPDLRMPSVVVDPRKAFQTIVGFGGAFTEAAAATLAKLPSEIQAEIIRAYFDPRAGHGYTLCRTHLNSCDFCAAPYSCDEVAGDVALKHFNIARDRRTLIPMIRRARDCSGGRLQLLISPWSPPAWMKTTGDRNHGGQLRPEMRATWAAFFVRFIREYAAEGIPVWGLTVQNEPEASPRWDSCLFTAAEERDFVRDHLGPALNRSGLGQVKIIIWDHNRDRIYERARIVCDDPRASAYIWGIGYHWYCGHNFDNVLWVHEAFPEKHLLLTEACVESGPHLGRWEVGERYAWNIINDLNHWAVGWVDWNLLLDVTGGPNHADNFCSAPILAEPGSGKVHYQSSYYYLGHFARFIRPGARRIICVTSRDELEATAFQNADNSLAAVILNRSDRLIDYALKYGERTARLCAPAHSIQTGVFSA